LLKNRIELYIGQIKPLIDSGDKLSRGREGDYKFNIKKVTEERMYLKEIPEDYYLEKNLEFPYDLPSERGEFKRIKEGRLSPDELEKIKSGLKLDT
jgi:hypothetical protein